MYQLGLTTQFEAAHHLEGPFGPASRLHGHTYHVEVVLEGRDLGPLGTLYDLGLLREHLNAVVSPLHYQNLDELPAFKGHPSTLERVADHLAHELSRLLSNGDIDAVHVKVWESPQVFAARRIDFTHGR